MTPVWFNVTATMLFWGIFCTTVYVLAIKAWDWWMLKPRRRKDPSWMFNAGVLPSSEARERIRTELQSGDVVYYNRCKYCGLVVMEGTTQLEAWQAYSSHVASRHQ